MRLIPLREASASSRLLASQGKPERSGKGGQFGFSCHCEFIPAVGRPAWMKPVFTIMAVLVRRSPGEGGRILDKLC